VLADPRASTLRKATGWYELGRAWEEEDAIKPGLSDVPERPQSENAARAYENAVAAAPGSKPAGDAACRLIDFSERYEWEGDVDGKAD
jgi:hypothetical protein